ncbi:MAG: c-type cytochrome, partial [Gemmatimonadota bacterium]|nr:c-type cytochrome [Gemmatimonadota bacterium]
MTPRASIRPPARRRWILALAAASTVASALAGTVARAQPLSPFATAKAQTLLREKYSCLGCHRLGTEGGVLAPALHDVRTRRDAAYIAAIVRDPQRLRPGAAMPRTRMPESDRQLITRFLGGDVTAGLPASPAPAPATTAPTTPPDTNGAALYRTWCAGCHGATGQGNGPNAKALPVPPARHADAATMSQRPDDTLYDTIDGGGAIMNRSARMPAFGGTLSPVQIRA